MTYPTSYEALVGRAKLQPGEWISERLDGLARGFFMANYNCIDEWVLVLAAAGGVGIAAIQIAKGARPSVHRIFISRQHLAFV